MSGILVIYKYYKDVARSKDIYLKSGTEKLKFEN